MHNYEIYYLDLTVLLFIIFFTTILFLIKMHMFISISNFNCIIIDFIIYLCIIKILFCIIFIQLYFKV